MTSRTRKAGEITRRQFVGTAAGAAAIAAFNIVPRHVLGGPGAPTPPSGKINLAVIGVGGQGGSDLNQFARYGANVVALCDADWREERANSAAANFKKFDQAKKFKDFRVMLDEMDKQIDAVLVGIPDHSHSVAAMAAIKRGKHVYCEKPLAHSVWEVRKLMDAAKQHKVISQLGNQGHSFDTIRTFCEWVWDGAIGQVHTIHAGCGSRYSEIANLPRLAEKHEVPPGLEWDVWLGPAAYRPYHPLYLPGSWRRWTPFGTGVTGDWTCHVVDPVFWALDLGAPATVKAEVMDYDPVKYADTFPRGSVIEYHFPANSKRGPVTMFWHEGDNKIPRPDEFPEGKPFPQTGAVVEGDKGKIVYGSHGAGGVQIIPKEKADAYKKPPKSLPRAPENSHYLEWLTAIKEGRPANSDFSYGGPLTELALLGVIAIRHPGQELKWDGPNMRITNNADANRMLTPTFREGWSL